MNKKSNTEMPTLEEIQLAKEILLRWALHKGPITDAGLDGIAWARGILKRQADAMKAQTKGGK